MQRIDSSQFVLQAITAGLLFGIGFAAGGAEQMMRPRPAPGVMQPASAPVAAQPMTAPKAIQRMGNAPANIAPAVKPPTPNTPMPQTKLASPSAVSQMLPAVQSGLPASAMPTPQTSGQVMGSGLRKDRGTQVLTPAAVSKSELAAIKVKVAGTGFDCPADGSAAILSITDNTTQNLLVSGATIQNDRLYILGCHFGKAGVAALVMSSDPGKAMLLTQQPSGWIGDLNKDTGLSAILLYGTAFPYGKHGEKSGPWRLKIAIDKGATLTSSQVVYFVNECKDILVGCK